LAGIEGNLECTLDARHHSVSDAPSTVLPAAWVAACAAVAARHKCTPAVSGGIDNLNDASYTGHLSSNVPIFAALPRPAICNVITKEKITMTFQIARPRPNPSQADCLSLRAYWRSIAVIPNQHPATRAFAVREAAHWTRTAAAIARARQVKEIFDARGFVSHPPNPKPSCDH